MEIILGERSKKINIASDEELKSRLIDARLYELWNSMKKRCYNHKNSAFKYYGGRGVLVSESWKNNSRAFIDWAKANGYEQGLELDRKDNRGPYSPDNCRWVTHKQNMNNRGNTLTVTIGGETKTIADWIKDPRCACKDQHSIWYRIKSLNWPPEKAVTTPIRRKRNTPVTPALPTPSPRRHP